MSFEFAPYTVPQILDVTLVAVYSSARSGVLSSTPYSAVQRVLNTPELLLSIFNHHDAYSFYPDWQLDVTRFARVCSNWTGPARVRLYSHIGGLGFYFGETKKNPVTWRRSGVRKMLKTFHESPQFCSLVTSFSVWGFDIQRVRDEQISRYLDETRPGEEGEDYELNSEDVKRVEELVEAHEDRVWVGDKATNGALALLDTICRFTNLRTLCLIGFEDKVNSSRYPPELSANLAELTANLPKLDRLYIRSVNISFAQILLSANHPQHLTLYSWIGSKLKLPTGGARTLDLIGYFSNTLECFQGSCETLTSLKIGAPFEFPLIPTYVKFPSMRHILFHLKDSATAHAGIISLLSACQNLEKFDILSGPSAELLLPHLPSTLLSFRGEIHKIPAETYTAAWIIALEILARLPSLKVFDLKAPVNKLSNDPVYIVKMKEEAQNRGIEFKLNGRSLRDF